MGNLWRYQRDGVECGPVTGDDLRMLADSMRLRPTDKVCKDGTNHWFPASSIRGLFPKPAPAAAPPSGGRVVAVVLGVGLIVLVVGAGIALTIYLLHTPAPSSNPSPAVNPPPSPSPSPTPSPTPPTADTHEHLLKAMHKMTDALVELRNGPGKIGGDIKEERQALDKGINQTRKVLEAAGVDTTDKGESTDYKNYADHPHLRDALAEARAARAEVRDSHDDLGGEKDHTIAALDVAIDQLERALKLGK